jgi:hypothetical protein
MKKILLKRLDRRIKALRREKALEAKAFRARLQLLQGLEKRARKKGVFIVLRYDEQVLRVGPTGVEYEGNFYPFSETRKLVSEGAFLPLLDFALRGEVEIEVR